MARSSLLGLFGAIELSHNNTAHQFDEANVVKQSNNLHACLDSSGDCFS